jgi:death-on-curing protein
MSNYKWIMETTVFAVHDEQIAEHGGLEGLRDLPLLQSALARPQNLALYEEPDCADLAACYAIGIAKNHPFNDGNKRTAFVVMELFLMLNGFKLLADDGACVITMLKVASGELTEQGLADWIRAHMKAL